MTVCEVFQQLEIKAELTITFTAKAEFHRLSRGFVSSVVLFLISAALESPQGKPKKLLNF
jgi:hypothetical protein